VTATGYVIPHYDFDQVEEVEGPPDIDEVLDEIRQRDVVEDVIFPVFYVDLVLNVPTPTCSVPYKESRESKVRGSSPKSGSRSKKGVTFLETSESGMGHFVPANVTSHAWLVEKQCQGTEAFASLLHSKQLIGHELTVEPPYNTQLAPSKCLFVSSMFFFH